LPKIPRSSCHDGEELGIYIDAELSMRTHVVKTTSACFAVLRNILSIRRSVTQLVLVSLVLSLLVYEDATLVGLPVRLLDRLQPLQNAAAHLIYSAHRYDRATPLVRSLY
jgi:hypothetical protein